MVLMNLFAGQGRSADIENGLGNTVAEGEGGTNWETGTDIYMLLLLLLLLSRFSRVPLCATPETTAHQAPPSLGFSRQEHWRQPTSLY